MKQFSVAVIGLGNRGWAYSRIMKAMPDKFRVVAVADPLEDRRELFRETFELADESLYLGWEQLLSKPRLADLAIISTMDDMHYEPAMKAIELGYNILLEKPVAPTAQQCADIVLAAEKYGVSVLVCHVLRYTPFFKTIKNIIKQGMIGRIMSIDHIESVGNIHQSHSYIRGNWHSEQATSPMLLAKCCHDLDMIQWLIDKPCRKVSSFGDLTYFKKDNAPDGAPIRCADGGCPVVDTCPYNCMKLYYEDKKNAWFRDASVKGIRKGTETTDEDVLEALKTTDYGLCVFHANNDVVDHQVVNMEFTDSATASLTMNAFGAKGRFIRIFGTLGELRAYASDKSIDVYSFEDKQHHMIPLPDTNESILGGHGGGDAGIISDLYEYLFGTYKGDSVADIRTSVNNHLVGFAAEKARHTDAVVNIDSFFGSYGFDNTYPAV